MSLSKNKKVKIKEYILRVHDDSARVRAGVMPV